MTDLETPRPKRARPWIDGEKIPDDELEDIYRPPPGFQPPLLQSHLIIGARGAGKTTLLRHLKKQHEGQGGLALSISLAAVLPEHARESGMGVLSSYITPSQSLLLQARTVSLLAVKLSQALAAKNVAPPFEYLRACLPRLCRHLVTDGANPDWELILTSLSEEAPDAFTKDIRLEELTSLISALGEQAAKTRGSLLLLFDRADQISPNALPPIFRLLSQAGSYHAVVAMRPGHSGIALESLIKAEAPGDPYKLLHLGTSPRSPSWQQFITDAVGAQVPELLSFPSELKGAILLLARDSVRWGLELAAGGVREGDKEQLLQTAAEDLRDNLLAAAQNTLSGQGVDIRALVNDTLKEAEKVASIACPLVLKIDHNLMMDSAEIRLTRLIQAALRCGLFSMLPDTHWVPGFRPPAVEIPPLLTIHKDYLSAAGKMKEVSIRRSPDEIFKSQYGSVPRTPTLFIAYRMNSLASIAFRDGFAEAIADHPILADFKVVDGHVPGGVRWPPTIRHRIQRSKIVVADVTGLSLEVMFELGFAFGLHKPCVPVVEREEVIQQLPKWLNYHQVETYDTHGDLDNILSAVTSHLTDPEISSPDGPRKPVTNLVVWLSEQSWSAHVQEQIATLCEPKGLKFELYGTLEHYSKALERSASAALLIATLNGTRDDAFVHYVTGAVVAKSRARGSLARRVVLVEEPGRTGKLVADSVRRCQDVVHVVNTGNCHTVIEDWLSLYAGWVRSGMKRI